MSEWVQTFRRNTRLLLNAIDGISDEDSLRRPNENTNHIRFLTAHLIDVRHLMATTLRIEADNELEVYLKNARSIEDVGELPGMKERTRLWSGISGKVDLELSVIPSESMHQESTVRFPLTSNTFGDKIAFLIQHEMFHIGQIALIRKFLGYRAMKWS